LSQTHESDRSATTVAGVLAFALAGSFAFALGVRAAVISMSSQANAFGQIAGGPLIGAVGTFGGIRAALSVAGLVLSPALDNEDQAGPEA
jgi:hypothetical protein